MKKYLCIILTICLVFTALAVSKKETQAANIVLPLPGSGTYYVTVLSKYSGGSGHASYISQYVLGQGAYAYPNMVMDISASGGTAVYAIMDGTISENNNHTSGGYNVVIKHTDGTYSYYGHLRERSPKAKGTSVKCGDLIGYVGMTGSATGNHLHFEWSGHDPYCEFVSMGYDLRIASNSGASAYPHGHATPTPPANIGTNFNAIILNTAAWKPITCDNDNYVRLRTETGVASQVWRFIRQSDGSYMIISAQAGSAQNPYVLSIPTEQNANGAQVGVSPEWGGNNLRWFLYPQGNGYVFMPKNSTTRVMDLPSNATGDGTTLQLYDRNNSDAQIYSVYSGSEVQLTAPTLTVTAGTSATQTTFNWSEVYGEKRYDLKIWKDRLYSGDAYHIAWGATRPFGITLPAGHYEAYVDAANELEWKMSNVVIFDVVAATNAATPSITSQPTDKTVYVGGAASISVAASVSKGTLSYQWYSNTSKTNSGGTSISGATSTSYNAPTSATGTRYYYCVVTNTDNTATGNKTAAATSNAVSVTVAAPPTPTPTRTPTPTPIPISTKRGDANGDHVVNAADAAAILRHLVRLQTLSPQGLINAKVTDGPGPVSAADAAKILRWLVRLEKEL